MRISKLGVVGAGTMGSGIAALAASAGIPVVLLDIPAKDGDRSGVAKGGGRFRVNIKEKHVRFVYVVDGGEGHVNFQRRNVRQPNECVEVIADDVVYVAF